MARLAELPPELLLHIVSFLTRETILDPMMRLGFEVGKPELVPDLPSVNALSRTNSIFHHTLNHTLYHLCASVESLGRLALLFAVEHSSEAAFDKLVAAGINADGKSRFIYGLCSLLHIAAGMGSSPIVLKLLRTYGSETLERVYARDGNGLSALDYAVIEGHMETIRLLAPIAILATSSSSPIAVDLSDERIQAHKEYLGRALVRGGFRSPLGEKTAICEYLLSEGADVNTVDPYHRRSLMNATISDSLATMRVLLAAGADPNLGDRDGVVPLFKAENVPAMQALLDAGAHIHATDNAGCNALMYWVAYPKGLRILLERGADPNHTDNEGRTSLHYACELKVVAAIELLIQFGAATVEKADTAGVTPAALAMQKGKIEVVRLFEPLIQDPALKAKIAKWLQERGGPEDTG